MPAVGYSDRLEASRNVGNMLSLARENPIKAATKVLTAGYVLCCWVRFWCW